MGVVAAGMADADGFTGITSRSPCRCVGQTSVFPYGKRVHVSSGEHGLAFPIPQDADDAGTANLIDGNQSCEIGPHSSNRPILQASAVVVNSQ
jgi:hypothetical protein